MYSEVNIMEIEKRYQVAVSKNAKGEITHCYDVEIVKGEKYKAYKLEAAKEETKALEEKEIALKRYAETLQHLESVSAKRNLLVAKAFFDNEVASGKCETNDLFEKDFDNFVYNKIELEFKNAPKEFIAILERLG